MIIQIRHGALAALLALPLAISACAKPPAPPPAPVLSAAEQACVARAAATSGLNPATIQRLMNDDESPIHSSTAAAIVANYKRLADVHPPQRHPDQMRMVTLVRSGATERGYAPPAAWDDIDQDAKPRWLRPPHGRQAARDGVAFGRPWRAGLERNVGGGVPRRCAGAGGDRIQGIENRRREVVVSLKPAPFGEPAIAI